MIDLAARRFITFGVVLAAACQFDFDAYDPRASAASSAVGSGAMAGTTVASSSQESAVSSSTAAAGGMNAGGRGGMNAGGAGGGVGGARACMLKYGGVTGFLLCEADETSCSFNADKGTGTSCTDVCLQAGGTCITCYTNGEPNLCAEGGMKSCTVSDSFNDICVCTL